MSFLLTLSHERLDELIPILARYEGRIKAAAPIFQLEGRRLEEIIRSIPQHQEEYDRALQEIKAVEEWLTNIKDKIVGRLWKKYNEGYSRTLSARDIQAYIGAEQEVVDINQLLIEVTVLKNSFTAIVEAIKNAGWMVGHITKLRVAELQDTIL